MLFKVLKLLITYNFTEGPKSISFFFQNLLIYFTQHFVLVHVFFNEIQLVIHQLLIQFSNNKNDKCIKFFEF